MSRIKSPEPIKVSLQQEAFLMQSSSSKLSKLKEKKSQNKGQESVRRIIELKRLNNRKNQQISGTREQDPTPREVKSTKIKSNKQLPQRKTLTYQYQMLRKIPQQITTEFQAAPQKNRIRLQCVEQMFLFTNYLIEFSDLAFQKFTFLKKLDLSENMISEIPAKSINENLINLESLKLNSNQIQLLPYLKHIKNLELIQNPIRKITREIISMNIETLQLDWLQYLSIDFSSIILSSLKDNELYEKKSPKNLSLKCMNKNNSKIASVQVLKYQYLKKLNQKHDVSHQYYDFKTIFQIKVQTIRQQSFQEIIAELLAKAIEMQHSFFIQYLNKNFPELQYNRMSIYNRFLLEDALQIKGSYLSRQVMGLFMPKKQSYEGQFPFVDNLFIAIKHQSVPFFMYLIELSNASLILSKNKNKIIEILLVQHKETSQASFIATVLLQKLLKTNNKNKQSQTIQIVLSKYPLSKSRAIMSFWNFIIRNQKLNKHIILAPRSSFYQNSILHFAIKSPYVEETLQLMLNSENKLQIFAKNANGQTIKSQFSGNRIFKKVLWKLQQEFFANHFQKNRNLIQNKPVKIKESKIKKLNNNPFIKLSQFRTKSLKQIIKLLGIQCPQIKSILKNCKQNQYTQKQQQMSFILRQIIKRFSIIQKQINPEIKKISTYEFQMIIFKLLQTQIFDKRSYLAEKIGQILLQNQTDKNKTSNEINQKKVQQNSGYTEINYSDDFLLSEYQLLHSIPFLKTQNFMVSSSLLENKEYKLSPQKGIFDISRFGCQKCQ